MLFIALGVAYLTTNQEIVVSVPGTSTVINVDKV